MNFEYTPKMKEWIARVSAFMDKHIYPNVETFEKQHAAGDRWVTPQIVHDLKAIAKKEGLWNMFMPPNKEHDGEFRGAGLTNLEYAPLAELMGRVSILVASDEPTAGSVIRKAERISPFISGLSHLCFCSSVP